MPQALRLLGFRVEIHIEHFEQEADDDYWIPIVGSQGWIILTKDRQIRNNQLELRALLKSGTPSFTLTSSETTGLQNAKTLERAMPDMLALMAKLQPPFIANVTPAGAVNVILRLSDILKKIV